MNVIPTRNPGLLVLPGITNENRAVFGCHRYSWRNFWNKLKAESKTCEPLLYYNLRPVPAFFLCRCTKDGMGSIRHPSKQTTTRERIISM